MAAEEARVVGSMPPPPAYYKLFAPGAAGPESDAKLETASAPAAAAAAAGEAGTAAAAGAAGGAEAGGVAAGAPDAFPLEPPPPPGPSDTYKMFGMPYSSEPIAEELLPPEKMVVPPSGQSVDFRAELKALLNSIMANYGQFMEMLVSSPSHAHQKLSDVETLFVNFHTLLNRYRAHQARHLILQRLRQQAKENAEVMSSLEAAMQNCASAQKRAKACLSLSNGTVGDATRVDGDSMDVADVLGGDREGLEVDGSCSSSSGVVVGVGGGAGGGALGGVQGAPLPGAAGGRPGKGGRR
ncbi:unnamed protein product [Laminaria digitata]